MFSIRCVLIKVLTFFFLFKRFEFSHYSVTSSYAFIKSQKNYQYQRNFLDIEEIDRVRTGEGTGRNETSVMGSSVVFDEI